MSIGGLYGFPTAAAGALFPPSFSLPTACFIAAFTLLCLFRLPLPLFGPSIGMTSTIRFLFAAICSARCFSRFLSLGRNAAVMVLLSRDPYAAWKASSFPDSTCIHDDSQL